MLTFILSNKKVYNLVYVPLFFTGSIATTFNKERPEPIHSQIFDDVTPFGGQTRFTYNFISSQQAEKFLQGQEVEDFLFESSFSTGKRILIRASSDLSYACQLPSYSETNYSHKEDKIIPPINFTESAIEAIDSLQETCSEKLISGWEYKICFGKKVTQTSKQSSKKKTIEYILGDAKYPTPPLPNTYNLFETYYGGLNSQPPHWYIAQRWTEGTFCEETKRPRETEIRYRCLLQYEEGLIHIQEISVCNYILTINIKSLCTEKIDENLVSQDHTMCMPIIDGNVLKPVPNTISTPNKMLKFLIGPGKWFNRWSFENQAMCKPEDISLLKISTLVQHLSFTMGADTRVFKSSYSDDEIWVRPGKLYAIYEEDPKNIIGVLNLQDMLDIIILRKNSFTLLEWIESPEQLEIDLLSELRNASHPIYQYYSYVTPFQTTLV